MNFVFKLGLIRRYLIYIGQIFQIPKSETSGLIWIRDTQLVLTNMFLRTSQRLTILVYVYERSLIYGELPLYF